MMANHQVVMIKEAQTIKNIENLAPYLEKPLKSTILVICYKYKKLDRRKKFTKDVAKNGVLFVSKKLYEDKIQGWISVHLSKYDYKITPPALVMLTEHLGSDLGTIVKELEKLMVNSPKGSEINADHIEANIGITKEFNRFELQKALGTRNVVKANQIINYIASNPSGNPAVLTISSLASYFSKLVVYHKLPDKSRNNVASMLKVSPYFVSEYEIAARNYQPAQLEGVIENLRIYDMRSKGVENVSASGDELVKELVYKILH
jgi:DNA polymerase-3 subunit delta